VIDNSNGPHTIIDIQHTETDSFIIIKKSSNISSSEFFSDSCFTFFYDKQDTLLRKLVTSQNTLYYFYDTTAIPGLSEIMPYIFKYSYKDGNLIHEQIYQSKYYNREVRHSYNSNGQKTDLVTKDNKFNFIYSEDGLVIGISELSYNKTFLHLFYNKNKNLKRYKEFINYRTNPKPVKQNGKELQRVRHFSPLIDWNYYVLNKNYELWAEYHELFYYLRFKSKLKYNKQLMPKKLISKTYIGKYFFRVVPYNKRVLKIKYQNY
jgi:hypothetical protein